MSTEREFTIPKARLHLADGTSFDVSITNGDRLQWDLTAPRKKWGKASDVPVLAQTFISFVAARREKHIDSAVTFEQWQDLLVGMVDLEDEIVVRPTRTELTDEPS